MDCVCVRIGSRGVIDGKRCPYCGGRGNYAAVDYYRSKHHKRYVRNVEARQRPLVCQDCGGSGGETEPVLDYGQGPFVECGWCEGTGLVTPHIRSAWLRDKWHQKHDKED